MDAYMGSLDWPAERQQLVAARIVRGTVNRIIAELPALPDAIRHQCRQAISMPECRDAAWAAADAAAWAAAWAATPPRTPRGPHTGAGWLHC